MNKNNLKINYWFLLAIFGVMSVSGAVAIFFSFKTNAVANQKIEILSEAKRPANLDLVMITDQTCKDCFDLTSVINNLKKENIKITSEKNIDSTGDEGKQLIAKFAIKKLPAFLLKGELKKNSILSQFFSKTGDINDGTFVFRQVGGPYVSTENGKVKGRINLILITDITCSDCYDVTNHETILKQFGMQPKVSALDIKSAAGIVLKNKYGIKMAPTFVMTGDVNEYPGLKSAWPEVGMIAYDGAYVFTKGVPFMGVYKNLTTNKVVTSSPSTAK